MKPRWVVAWVIAGCVSFVPIVGGAVPAGAEPPCVPPPPTVAAAAPTAAPARLANRFVLRSDLNLTHKGDPSDLFGPVADASSLGLTFGGNVLERLAFEATFGLSPGRSGHPDGAGGLTGVAAGPTFMGATRYAPLMTPNGRHALTAAVGAYALLGGGFGSTTFAHGEVAYEYRGPYVTVLGGYGANYALNDSKRQDVDCGGFLETCAVGFDRGDVLGHFRVSVGVTF